MPAFSLTIGSADVTARLTDRLISLTVSDKSGEESDELEIVLDDRAATIEAPRKGAALSLALGYEGDALHGVGSFVVDEVEFSGPPDQLTIRAKAADMRETLKVLKTRAWRATTLRDVLAKIAAEHGLQPQISASLGAVAVPHRDQTNESDLHFLTRLGRDHGAVAAPKDGRLVFAPAGTGRAVSGTALAAVTLARGDLTSWRSTAADRAAHGKVRARWRDLSAGRTRYAEAGEGTPVRTLRQLYRDQAAAQAAAQAELGRSQRAENGIELTLPGRAEISAQTPITVTGLRDGLSGSWIAATVEHRLDWSNGGFTTSVQGSKSATA